MYCGTSNNRLTTLDFENITISEGYYEFLSEKERIRGKHIRGLISEVTMEQEGRSLGMVPNDSLRLGV